MATAETRQLTIEDWKALPEGRPYFEFEEGELIPMASPTPEHSDVVRELGSEVYRYVRRHGLGRIRQPQPGGENRADVGKPGQGGAGQCDSGHRRAGQHDGAGGHR